MAYKNRTNHRFEQTDSVSSKIIPATSGDRYWAQDMARDMAYLRGMVGEVVASFLKNESQLLYTSVVQGSDNVHVDVGESAGMVKVPFILADDAPAFQLPQPVKTETLDVMVKTLGQTGVILGGTNGTVKLRFKETEIQSRVRHYTGSNYPYVVMDDSTIIADNSSPLQTDIVLAKYEDAGGSLIIRPELSYRNKVEARLRNIEHLGGYVSAYDFGTATPDPADITAYVRTQIPTLVSDEEIPNGTRVRNLFDDNIWLLNNDPGGILVFSWANVGRDNTYIADNSTLGLVKGSTAVGKVSVNDFGEMSANLAVVDGTYDGLMSVADKTKLDGIETAATVAFGMEKNATHGRSYYISNGNWTCPAGVYVVSVTVVGGGGGGGGGGNGWSISYYFGGGGGGGGASGCVTQSMLMVTPGTVYGMTVGAGGNGSGGGLVSNAAAGGTSTAFIHSSIPSPIIATGGNPGKNPATNGGQGAGGAVTVSGSTYGGNSAIINGGGGTGGNGAGYSLNVPGSGGGGGGGGLLSFSICAYGSGNQGVNMDYDMGGTGGASGLYGRGGGGGGSGNQNGAGAPGGAGGLPAGAIYSNITGDVIMYGGANNAGGGGGVNGAGGGGSGANSHNTGWSGLYGGGGGGGNGSNGNSYGGNGGAGEQGCGGGGGGGSTYGTTGGSGGRGGGGMILIQW